MAAHKKPPGAVFNNAKRWPERKRHGWQRIKKPGLSPVLFTHNVNSSGAPAPVLPYLQPSVVFATPLRHALPHFRHPLIQFGFLLIG